MKQNSILYKVKALCKFCVYMYVSKAYSELQVFAYEYAHKLISHWNHVDLALPMHN